MGEGLFPAQMETQGPHVASVVFPRRSGAKAGSWISKPQRGALSRALPGFPLPLPRASASLFPVASGLAFGLCFCISSPASATRCQPTVPSPSGFGQCLRSSGIGFGSQWFSNDASCCGPRGPSDRPQNLETREHGG